MSTYVPERWVVVEIDYNGEKIRKVLASWYGGFAGADSWKLSSGITETKEFDDRYEFLNHSGSTYVCLKSCEGMSGLMSSVFWSLFEQLQERAATLTIISFDKDEVK